MHMPLHFPPEDGNISICTKAIVWNNECLTDPKMKW